MSRVIRKADVPTFMKAVAKRARKRWLRGWRPVCVGGLPVLCDQLATHVDQNNFPYCPDHAAEQPTIMRFR